MTIDHESIVEKKAHLQQAVRVLQQLQKRSVAELSHNEIEFGSVLHYLTVGIESILDMGSHILTEDFGLSPQTYEDSIRLLGEKHIISTDLAQRSSGMGKFRNKMIHEYADINAQKVYNYLQKAPAEFEQFDQAFTRYLQS